MFSKKVTVCALVSGVVFLSFCFVELVVRFRLVCCRCCVCYLGFISLCLFCIVSVGCLCCDLSAFWLFLFHCLFLISLDFAFFVLVICLCRCYLLFVCWLFVNGGVLVVCL